MSKPTVMGVTAPPPRLSILVKVVAGVALLAFITGAGILLDPFFRWLLGLG